MKIVLSMNFGMLLWMNTTVRGIILRRWSSKEHVQGHNGKLHRNRPVTTYSPLHGLGSNLENIQQIGHKPAKTQKPICHPHVGYHP